VAEDFFDPLFTIRFEITAIFEKSGLANFSGEYSKNTLSRPDLKAEN
jgi:hypothetical protein